MVKSRTTGEFGVPWRSQTLMAILASTVILPLGVPMLGPVLPALRDHFGVGDPGASLVLTMYFLPAVLLSPLIGVLIDQVGRRRVLGVALGTWGVAGLAVASGPSYEAVLFLRLVQGAAAAGVLIVTVTLIGDVYEGVQRNAVIGVNAAALLLGAAIAPLVGGVLVGYGWNAPFGVFVIGFPVAVFVLHAIAEPKRTMARSSFEYVRGAAEALPNRPALGLYGSAVIVEFVGFGAILTAIPFILEGTYETTPVVIGAVIAAELVFGAFISANNGWFAARMTSRALISLGFIVIGASLLFAWIADGPLQFGVAAAAFGSGYGLVFPTVDASINAIAPSTYRAGALSLRNSASFLGRGTGPVAFALAASSVGYRPVLATAGGAVLLVAIGATVAAHDRSPSV